MCGFKNSIFSRISPKVGLFTIGVFVALLVEGIATVVLFSNAENILQFGQQLIVWLFDLYHRKQVPMIIPLLLNGVWLAYVGWRWGRMLQTQDRQGSPLPFGFDRRGSPSLWAGAFLTLTLSEMFRGNYLLAIQCLIFCLAAFFIIYQNNSMIAVVQNPETAGHSDTKVLECRANCLRILGILICGICLLLAATSPREASQATLTIVTPPTPISEIQP